MTKASRPCGSGPGPITPDGCAVDFYAQLPDNGEAAIVHDAAGAGASILELGCGAGRVTRPLAALGHQVVAVDESPEMLAHVRDAETVCARIEDLRLGRRFGAVLLASHLINADDDTRSAFLAACRRHVAGSGCVIVQQHPRAWFSAARATETTRDGIIYRMRDVSRPAPNLVSATVEYLVGDERWTQTFTATLLDETELAAALAAAGLRLDRYLTEDRSWFRAVPADTASSTADPASGRRRPHGACGPLAPIDGAGGTRTPCGTAAVAADGGAAVAVAVAVRRPARFARPGCGTAARWCRWLAVP